MKRERALLPADTPDPHHRSEQAVVRAPSAAAAGNYSKVWSAGPQTRGDI